MFIGKEKGAWRHDGNETIELHERMMARLYHTRDIDGIQKLLALC